MVAARTYPPGVPCWIDVEHTDPDAACDFYGRVLDWTFEDQGTPEASYHVAHLSGVPVAGIARATVPGAPGTGSWNTYVAVADAGVAAEAVRAAGGAVEGEPVDAGPAGTLVRCVDPAGARLRLWQAGDRAGAQAVNVPGAWNFSDLHTPDPEAAFVFYHEVFGWEMKGVAAGGADWATMLQVPGYGEHLRTSIDPGIRERHRDAPEGFSDGIGWVAPLEDERDDPHWHVTLFVADRDAAVSSARRLGAEILFERDTRWNRAALIVDPQGAPLTLSQFAASA